MKISRSKTTQNTIKKRRKIKIYDKKRIKTKLIEKVHKK
jgi:hypothetical protein